MDKRRYTLPDPPPINYYVYEWYDEDTGQVFYVGKGCKDRVIQLRKSKRNRFFLRYLNKHNCNFRIVKDDLTQDEALELESKIYFERKSSGECECNIIDADPNLKGVSLPGELNGMYGKTHSHEARKLIGDANIEFNKVHLNSNSRHTIAYNKETKAFYEFNTKKDCMFWLCSLEEFNDVSEMSCYRIIGYSNEKQYSYNNWCFKVLKVHEKFDKDDTVSSFENDYRECPKVKHTSVRTYEEDVTTKERQRSFYYNNVEPSKVEER